MTDPNVSPLPWKYSKDREDVLASDGSPVVVSGFRLSGGGGPRSNREFLIRCVNSHDRLVAALEAAKTRFRLVMSAEGRGFGIHYIEGCSEAAIEDIDAALAAAKEGQ